MSRIAFHFLVPVIALASSESKATQIALVALDAHPTLVGNPGGTFGITDTNNLWGQGLGAPLGLRVNSIGLLQSSTIPNANLGELDFTTGAFSMNWGFSAQH